MDVTLELWTIVRAATGDEIVRWAICREGMPLGMYYETRDEAERICRSWGWTVVASTDVEVVPE